MIVQGNFRFRWQITKSNHLFIFIDHTGRFDFVRCPDKVIVSSDRTDEAGHNFSSLNPFQCIQRFALLRGCRTGEALRWIPFGLQLSNACTQIGRHEIVILLLESFITVAIEHQCPDTRRRVAFANQTTNQRWLSFQEMVIIGQFFADGDGSHSHDRITVVLVEATVGFARMVEQNTFIVVLLFPKCTRNHVHVIFGLEKARKMTKNSPNVVSPCTNTSRGNSSDEVEFQSDEGFHRGTSCNLRRHTRTTRSSRQQRYSLLRQSSVAHRHISHWRRPFESAWRTPFFFAPQIKMESSRIVKPHRYSVKKDAAFLYWVEPLQGLHFAIAQAQSRSAESERLLLGIYSIVFLLWKIAVVKTKLRIYADFSPILLKRHSARQERRKCRPPGRRMSLRIKVHLYAVNHRSTPRRQCRSLMILHSVRYPRFSSLC